MQKKQTPGQKPAGNAAYFAIAVVGFLVSIAVVYYYLRFIQGKVSDQVDQKIFYLILILFGISSSALVFGVMNSYAVLKGEKLDTKYKFTGPIVGVILTVAGGFYLPKGPTEKIITLRAFDENNTAVTQGEVKLYLPGFIRTQSIDKMGQAQFTDIPENILSNKIRIDISSPGFINRSLDTVLQYSSAPIPISLYKAKTILVSGRVKDAAEIPIKNVEINVEGTKFDAVSITDGTYLLKLQDYTVGDRITLTTSHKDFEDKIMTLTINAPEMQNVDFVLNHTSPTTQ